MRLWHNASSASRAIAIIQLAYQGQVLRSASHKNEGIRQGKILPELPYRESLCQSEFSTWHYKPLQAHRGHRHRI